MSRLTAHRLEVAVGGRPLCSGLELTLAEGQRWGIIGRNGAGKTLLLHTLAGLRPAAAGEVQLDGQPLTMLKRRHIARHVGLMAQESRDPFPATVLETVESARHPHLPLWRREGERERELARDALQRVDLADLEQRDAATLSGGERRRLALAAILCQQPDLLLLDEPANHLDLQHQMTLLRELDVEANAGRCVAAVFHDINLAARFCDHLLLLFGDGRWRAGTAEELLTGELLSELVGWPLNRLEGPAGAVFIPG